MVFWDDRIGKLSWVISHVHVLDILVSVDSEDFFHNFCDGGKFLNR